MQRKALGQIIPNARVKQTSPSRLSNHCVEYEKVKKSQLGSKPPKMDFCSSNLEFFVSFLFSLILWWVYLEVIFFPYM
jgi:hypothetical protein